MQIRWPCLVTIASFIRPNNVAIASFIRPGVQDHMATLTPFLCRVNTVGTRGPLAMVALSAAREAVLVIDT